MNHLVVDSENTFHKMNHLVVNRKNKLHKIKETECILPPIQLTYKRLLILTYITISENLGNGVRKHNTNCNIAFCFFNIFMFYRLYYIKTTLKFAEYQLLQ